MGGRVGRILVVDDEIAMREICRRALEGAGHRVSLAESGPQALDIFRPGEFDLVLTDLMMPGMSGLELLTKLLDSDSDLACVMMTAAATVETAVEAIKRGAYNYVSKPFTPGELVALVERALEVRWLALDSARLREEAERNLLLLSTEQSRTRTIIRSMADGVLVTNRDGQLAFFNPALLRLLRIKQEVPAIGQPPSAELFPGELLDWVQESLDEPETSRVVRELSDGPPHLAANIGVIRDEEGEALGVVAVIRDITEAKRLEQRMAEFVSMVAHELRSPLGAIAQYLDVILSGITESQPEKQKQILSRCRSRTGALSRLVSDLLEFSRLQQGRTRGRTFAPVDLREVIEETVEFAAQPAASRSVALSSALPSELPLVSADREELTRLFTNLVDNAIKYNREGGSVRIEGGLRGGYVWVEVADTGLGIPADHLSRLGEAFYRVKTPKTAQITGTGLGLSICKQIAEAHEGHLEIESQEGEGSTFRVLLPGGGLAGVAPGAG